MKELFYSPVSGQVYFGNGIPLKNNPGVCVVRGNKIEVTQSFYRCLFQAFPPGGSYTMYNEDGKPLYELTLKIVQGNTNSPIYLGEIGQREGEKNMKDKKGKL
jgi:hypothetical protein